MNRQFTKASTAVTGAPAAPIPTWRERIGFGPAYQLHGATDVERAMVAQIADLEAALKAATTSAPAGRDDDTRQWVVLSGQRFAKAVLMDLQQDAARYRWLRDKADGMVGTAAPMVASLDDAGRVVDFLDGEDLDAAVDAAIPLRAAPKRKAAGGRR